MKTTRHATRTDIRHATSLLRFLTPLGRRTVLRYLACPLLAAIVGLGGNVWGQTFIPSAVATDTSVTDELVISSSTLNQNNTTATITMAGGTLKIDTTGLVRPEGCAVILGPDDLDSQNNYFNWGEGGKIVVSSNPLNSNSVYINEPVNLTKKLDVEFSNKGGALSISANAVDQENLIDGRTVIYFNGTNTFADLNVSANLSPPTSTTDLTDATVQVMGKSVYDSITADATDLFAHCGHQIINSNQDGIAIDVTNGGYVLLDGTSDVFVGAIQDSKDPTVYNVSSGIDINGKVNIDGGKVSLFGTPTTKGTATATVTKGALDTDYKSASLFTSVDLVAFQNSTWMISNIAKNATNATANIWYATKDEKGNVTAIQWDATRENIEKVIDDGYASSTTLTGTGDMYVRTYGATNDGTAYGLSHYNGNTFVFDNNDTTNWEGETGTQEGTIALTAGTVLGKNGGLSAVSISGEEYSLLDNDTYEVTQAGMLAFYRGDDTTSEAATINAFSIQFYDGCNYRSTKDNRIVKNDVVNGARIWFDAGQANNGCTTLANINATNIEFGSMTQVWYDRVSEVDSGTALTINLNKNARIATVTYDYENSGTPTDPTTFKTWEKNARTATIITDKATYLSELFGKAQLVKAEYDETTGAIKVNSVDAAKFAADNGMTEKEQEYAAQLDTNRTNANVNGIGGLDSKTTQDFYDALYNEEDAGKVKNTISNLSRGSGIENVPTMTQHLGSIGSPFSAGLGVGGVSTRGQEENMPVTAQGTPADSTSSSAMAYDNYDSGRTWTPWVSYSYSEIEGDEHTRDGVKYDSYKVQRSGVLAGFRSRLSDSLSAGILFAYSGPEMNQSGRFEGYDTIGQGGYASNIDMEDFQFALHFEKLLGWRQDWEFNAFIGGGAQSLDWQRTVYFNNIGHQFTGETTGNTFTATFYLAKRLQLSDRLVLRPTVGFDSEHNWMYGFDEQGNAIDNPDMMMAVHSQAFHYDRIEYSRNTIRVGMSAAFTPCHKQGGLSARIFYGHQLDEDDAATVHMTNNMGDWMVQGAAMGRDSWTLGAGGYWYFDDAQTLSISADYNAVLYDNASTQNVTATLTKRF